MDHHKESIFKIREKNTKRFFTKKFPNLYSPNLGLSKAGDIYTQKVRAEKRMNELNDSDWAKVKGKIFSWEIVEFSIVELP